jgi:predicted nucleic acid-binding protein
MLVLDTNVISELMKPEPERSVIEWADKNISSAYITSIVVAEMQYGIERKAIGRRRRVIENQFSKMLNDKFRDHILPFDEHSAKKYGVLFAKREKEGETMSIPDAQIASICMQHNAVLVTRNTRDFEGTGVALINPWD